MKDFRITITPVDIHYSHSFIRERRAWTAWFTLFNISVSTGDRALLHIEFNGACEWFMDLFFIHIKQYRYAND